MKRYSMIILLMVCVVVSSFSSAQDESQPIEATIFERLTVYVGPGNTYPIVAGLGSGVPVIVSERNDIGNWLKIERAATDTTEAVSGWVQTGYLTLPDGFSVIALPQTDLPSADLVSIEDDDLRRLYAKPIIPELSESMLAVYETGIEAGNNAGVVSKVGDSNTANPRYLEPLALGQVELSIYDHLQDVVDFYGPGFGKEDNATRVGLNTFSVFDPFWAHPTRCEPDETPLQCEYRNNTPAIAVIMFGQNDTRSLNSEQWEAQMQRVIEDTLDADVIPILVTFSSADDANVYQATIDFNLILLDLAETYDVPVINLWAAARALPNRGIGADDAHLTGGGDVMRFEGRESRDGVVLLNLLVLSTLHHFMAALPDADA